MPNLQSLTPGAKSPTPESARLHRLRAELDRIRTVLSGEPSVKQVRVFGSVALGTTHDWSDLDVMVVEETDQPFIDRALRLADLVNPQVGTQFVVYTPAELQTLADRPFVQVEILRKGRVLPMKPVAEAQRWLTFAAEDLRVAELTLEAGIYNQTCFHAQQCVEKCLKACLAVEGELLVRTHLIADLLKVLPATASQALRDIEKALARLDQFYIPTRYPDALPGTLPEGLPERHHAEVALSTARRCHELVQTLVARMKQ